MSATPNPFSPVISPVQISARILKSSSTNRDWAIFSRAPIFWTATITEIQQTTRKIVFPKVYLMKMGMGSVVSFSWSGKDKNGQSLPEKSYRLTIRALSLTGVAQRTLDIRIDKTPPQILNLFPEDGTQAGTSPIDITGTSNENLSQVFMDGSSGTVNGTSFSGQANLVGGENSIPIEIKDIAGNSATRTLHIIYDNMPPVLTNITPESGSWTNQTDVTIQGHIDDLNVVLTIDGNQTQIQPDGSFSQPITLSSEGENTIVIEARDTCANTTTLNHILNLDQSSPQITLDPSNLILSNPRPPFTVQYQDAGSGVDTSTLSVILDSVNITGQFSVTEGSATYTPTEPLSFGDHTWTVTVKDHTTNEITQGTSFTIQNVQEPQSAASSGYIDGTLLDSGSEDPVQGATITVDGLEGAVLSDRDGKFAFPVTESGTYNIRIARAGYIEAGRTVEAFKMRDTGLGTIYLKKEDTRKTTITSEGGVAEDSRSLIQMIFPQNAVSGSIQAGATWYDHGRELPGPLPEASQFTYAFDLAPDGATFSQPVMVRFKNTRGFPAGSEIPVGYWNKTLLQWSHEATATVTSDGQWAEFQVNHFSPRDANQPAPPPPPRTAGGTGGEGSDQSDPCSGDSGNSVVDYLGGQLKENINLVGYKALGRDQVLTLYYNSDTVNPYFRARVVKKLANDTTLTPDRISVGVDFEGQSQSLFLEGTLDAFQANFMLRKENARGLRLPTGLYRWKGKISYDYEGTNFWYTRWFGGPPETDSGVTMYDGEYAQYATSFHQSFINVNEVESPFGAGWQLEGPDRIYEDPAHDGYVVIGSGRYEKFSPQYQVFASLGSGGTGVVKAIDTVTDAVQTSYNVPNASWMIVTPDGSKLYIANQYDRNIRIIDLRTGALIKTLDTTGQGIAGTQSRMVITPDGSKLFIGVYYKVGSSFYNRICVIDTVQDQVITRISTLGEVADLAVSQDGQKLFAATYNQNYGYIEIFSTLNYSSLGWFHAGSHTGTTTYITRFAVQPSGNKIYAIGRNLYGGGYIYSLNAETNGVNKVIPTTRYPSSIAITPDGTRVITTHASVYGANIPDPGYLTIVDTAIDQAIGTIVLGVPYYPQNIVISPDGTRAYTANNYSKTISVIDVKKLNVFQQINTVETPFDLVMTPDGRKVYALCYGTKILVIDTSENNINSTIEIASGAAQFIAVTPQAASKVIALDESTITKEVDSTYTRTYKDQSKDHFDADGYKVSSCDTHGNCTQYSYEELTTGDRRLITITDPVGGETHLAYDQSARLQSITDPQGRQTRFVVDGKGDLAEITYPDGSSYRFICDGEHRITEKTTPRGYTTRYTYGDYGEITKVEAPTGETREYTPAILDQVSDPQEDLAEAIPYNPLGSYSEKKDALNNITKKWLDANGRTTKEEDPLGRITQYEYNARGSITWIIYPNGATEERTYDLKENLLTKKLIEIDALTTYTYDPKFNKVASITNAEGHITTFEYDQTTGDLGKIKDPQNHEWNIAYTAQGLVYTITDPQNRVTTYGYDPKGNLFSKTDALSYTTTYNRDSAGNMISTTDPLSHTTQYVYDSMNRLTQIIDPLSAVTQIAYEGSGCGSCGGSDLVAAIADPNGSTWHFEYDALGQLTRAIDPLGNITQKTYDLNRNLKTVTDALNHTTEYNYDAANQLIQQINADQGSIQYAYNDLGKVYSLTDPNGNTTYFDYDMFGRLISETDPLSHTTNYDYDKVGNLVQKTTPRGDAITYGYDELNRLIQKVTPEQTYNFGYDSLGRLTGAGNASSNLSFSYDALGRLIQTQTTYGSGPITLSYSYDNAGRKTGMTDPTGSTSYGYDARNLLTSIQDPQGNQFGFQYDVAGRRIQLSGPNGLLRTYAYDTTDRLTSITNKIGSVETSSFSFERNQIGNKTKITSTHGIDQYSYDEGDRLLASSLKAEVFGYDPAGNMISKSGITQTFNELNQLISSSNGLSLEYDGDGNLVSKTTSEGTTWSYVFSSENRLLQAISSDGKNISYQYDALGRKIKRTSGGTTTQYIYDREDVLLEYQNGVLISRYTHGTRVDEPLSKTDLITGQSYYYHVDDLGSVTAITDGTGSIIESYKYTSYGVPKIFDKDGIEISVSTVENTYLFTGQNYDFEVKLYDYWNRYYDPTLDRFISADPIGFDGGINLYAYCGSDPLNWIDPWGLNLEVSGYRRDLDSDTLDKAADAFYGKDDPRGQHYGWEYSDGTTSGYGPGHNGPDFGPDRSDKLKTYVTPWMDGERMREAERRVQKRWKEEYKKGCRRYNHPKNDCQTYFLETFNEYFRIDWCSGNYK